MYVLLLSSHSGCEVRGSCGAGAYLTIGLANRSQDDGSHGGPNYARKAATAGAAPDPAAAADSETTAHCRVSEAARKPDPPASGPAPGAHKGSNIFHLSLTLSAK